MHEERTRANEIVREVKAIDFIDAILKLYSRDEIKTLKIDSLKHAIGDAVEVLEMVLDEPHEYISTAALRRLRDNMTATLKRWDAV